PVRLGCALGKLVDATLTAGNSWLCPAFQGCKHPLSSFFSPSLCFLCLRNRCAIVLQSFANCNECSDFVSSGIFKIFFGRPVHDFRQADAAQSPSGGKMCSTEPEEVSFLPALVAARSP
ncbi:MAG: hypothetical protein LBB51_00115, partial [Zoogloeaceae bacterium]|nr:hypothetical protein [Zoogloeaceae bacterium]